MLLRTSAVPQVCNWTIGGNPHKHSENNTVPTPYTNVLLVELYSEIHLKGQRVIKLTDSLLLTLNMGDKLSRQQSEWFNPNNHVYECKRFTLATTCLHPVMEYCLSFVV